MILIQPYRNKGGARQLGVRPGEPGPFGTFEPETDDGEDRDQPPPPRLTAPSD